MTIGVSIAKKHEENNVSLDAGHYMMDMLHVYNGISSIGSSAGAAAPQDSPHGTFANKSNFAHCERLANFFFVTI